ncbi:hypothetical protein CL634_01565 [bacterium]|nr:hypothetical protein [bacterium]
MKLQHEHKVVSSFLFFLEHELCTKGKAYTNHTSNFYPVESAYENYFTYGAPFQQFVFDDSIGFTQGDKVRKPHVPSGIYLNDTYVQPGTSGLAAIDYSKGQLHFSLDYPAAGNVLPRASYAVKDLNIYLTNEPENKLLFETQFKLNPKVQQNPTGLPINVQTYPAIYVRNLTSTNAPITCSMTNPSNEKIYETENYIRAIALCDSAYLLDATCSLMKDMARSAVPHLKPSDQPFGPLGYTGGAPFRYKDVVSGHAASEEDHSIIHDVNVSKKSQNQKDFENLNSEVFVAFIDFTLKNMRDLT